MTRDPSDEAKVLGEDVAARVAVALGLVRQLKQRHGRPHRPHGDASDPDVRANPSLAPTTPPTNEAAGRSTP